MVPMCPLCHRVIPPDDFNVARDVAFCRACNESYSFADLMQGAELEAGLNLRQPPPHTWYRTDGLDTVAGASLHSLGRAIGSLAIALFWNGIVSVFVGCALSGTLYLLHIPTPKWFFAPKMNGHMVTWGDVTFLWLFLVPFIVVGLCMISSIFLSLFGKVEVRISRNKGAIFTGIGPLGWTRTFDAAQAASVRVVQTQNSNNSRSQAIELSFRGDRRPLKFGSMLWGTRQEFLAGALSRLIKDPQGA